MISKISENCEKAVCFSQSPEMMPSNVLLGPQPRVIQFNVGEDKETGKYSHLRSWNQRIWTSNCLNSLGIFFNHWQLIVAALIDNVNWTQHSWIVYSLCLNTSLYFCPFLQELDQTTDVAYQWDASPESSAVLHSPDVSNAPGFDQSQRKILLDLNKERWATLSWLLCALSVRLQADFWCLPFHLSAGPRSCRWKERFPWMKAASSSCFAASARRAASNFRWRRSPVGCSSSWTCGALSVTTASSGKARSTPLSQLLQINR